MPSGASRKANFDPGHRIAPRHVADTVKWAPIGFILVPDRFALFQSVRPFLTVIFIFRNHQMHQVAVLF